MSGLEAAILKLNPTHMKHQTKVLNVADFTNQIFYIGIDVHKKQWTVTLRLDGTYIKTITMPPSAAVLAKHLQTNYPNGIYFSVYEAGFCGTSHHEELCALGIKNIIINPADLPMTHKLKTIQTDYHDSRALAEYLEAGKLKAIHVFSREQQELRSLCRLRNNKRKDVTRSKNRIKGLLMYYGIAIPPAYQGKKCWSKRFLDWLKQQQLNTEAGTLSLRYMIGDLEYHRGQLLAVLKNIKTLMKEKFKEEWELLLSVPGIGPINVITMLSEIGNINRFPSPVHFASYLGLLPSVASSDETVIEKGINPRCNKYLRSMLMEASWVAIRTSASLLAYYKKHCYPENNKAIIKVARKLAMIVRGVWISRTRYQEGFIAGGQKKSLPNNKKKKTA